MGTDTFSPNVDQQSSSSWFRFGSRRRSEEKSDESKSQDALPQESVSHEADSREEAPQVQAMPAQVYEPPRYFVNSEPEFQSGSPSSWFSFRRPKSPPTIRENEVEPDPWVEPFSSVRQEPEEPPEMSQSSSWFRFRRAKSPSQQQD